MLNIEEKKKRLRERLKKDFKNPDELYNTLKSFSKDSDSKDDYKVVDFVKDLKNSKK